MLTTPANYQDIDGILWGWHWDLNLANGHTQLLYAFPTSPFDYAYFNLILDFEAFNAQQQSAALYALAQFDAVSNLDFVFTANASLGNIRFAQSNFESFDYNGNNFLDPIGTAVGNPPDPSATPPEYHGDTWFNSTDYDAPLLGNYAFSTIMHEAGHALGLKHGHLAQGVLDANSNLLYTNPRLPFDHDSLEYSIMSYRSYAGDTGPDQNPPLPFATSEFPTTLMQDDIFAIQWLYGANYEHAAENTIYMWSPATGEMFINGVGQGAPVHGKIFLTVWDGNGIDTYNFSNYTTNAVINLSPGAWSTPSAAQLANLDSGNPGAHLARGCIANAMSFANDFRAYIENAIGGSGRDQIVGNEIGNILAGGRGGDYLYGGAGRDFFDYNSVLDSRKTASSRDVIFDFQRGIDDIDLRTIDAKAGSGNQAFKWIGKKGFHDVKGELRIKDLGADVIVQGDRNGDGRVDFSLRVEDVGTLGKGDFIL